MRGSCAYLCERGLLGTVLERGHVAVRVLDVLRCDQAQLLLEELELVRKAGTAEEGLHRSSQARNVVPARLCCIAMAASSRWAALGETFYRREEIYSMQWPLQDLSDYLVAGARAGGPLGMSRWPWRR